MESVSPDHVRCAVTGESDQDGRNRQPSWFYFRIDGVAGREMTVDISDLQGEYNYRPHKGEGLRNTRPVLSYDDKHWQHAANVEFLPPKAPCACASRPRRTTSGSRASRRTRWHG